MKTLADLKRDGWESGINQVVMADCLEAMKLIPDKSIDLILTDPPYGIGADIEHNKITKKAWGHGSSGLKEYSKTNWDGKIPSKEVFEEMFRISKHQIIFGGNYMTDHLPASKCWIIWYKGKSLELPDAELAWASFNKPIRLFYESRADAYINKTDIVKSHPTQKSVELMRWILENYSDPTDLICDPFMGSWTTARACKDLGRNFLGFELEEDYCKVGEERLRQENLF